MRSRTGFARLLPLTVTTAVAAAAGIALLLPRWISARERGRSCNSGGLKQLQLALLVYSPDCDGCYHLLAPVPRRAMVVAGGRRWDVRGGALQSRKLRRVVWAGADLQRTAFVRCDFRGPNLRGVDLREATLLDCDFTGADLTGADLRGACYNRQSRWPAGFDPIRARGSCGP